VSITPVKSASKNTIKIKINDHTPLKSHSPVEKQCEQNEMTDTIKKNVNLSVGVVSSNSGEKKSS